MNNKFDPTNYLKHNKVRVYSNGWVKSSIEYRSSLLLIKWVSSNKLKINSNIFGLIEQNSDTAIGRIIPKIYQIQINESEYIDFLSLEASAPYTLKFKNPDSTTQSLIEIWEYIPANPSTMPWIPESTTQSDPALLAATTANASAINALATAIGSQPQAIALAINNDNSRSLPPAIFTVGTVPVLVLVQNNLSRGCNISNQGNTKIKLWCSDDPIPPTTSYSSSGYMIDLQSKGSYEVPDPFYKSNIWAVGNSAGGSISTNQSIDI